MASPANWSRSCEASGQHPQPFFPFRTSRQSTRPCAWCSIPHLHLRIPSPGSVFSQVQTGPAELSAEPILCGGHRLRFRGACLYRDLLTYTRSSKEVTGIEQISAALQVGQALLGLERHVDPVWHRSVSREDS